jgi:hypothetical protein
MTSARCAGVRHFNQEGGFLSRLFLCSQRRLALNGACRCLHLRLPAAPENR